MLLPFCTFKDNNRTIWNYRDSANPELKVSKDFAYCSLFRDNYAIFGEYIGESENCKILFGIIDIDLNIIEPAIYDSLEFYPNKSYCFIGTLGTNFNYHEELKNPGPLGKGDFHKEIIFNIKGCKFWHIGKEIVPINKDLFVVVNKPDKVNLYNSDGRLISELPFSISKESFFNHITHEKEMVDLVFDYVEKSNDLIRLKYYYCGVYPGEEGEYYYMHYYYFFNAKGDFLGESEKEDAYHSQFFMKSGWRNNLENIEIIPNDLVPHSLSSIHSELLKNNLVYSKYKHPSKWDELFVFELTDGTKFWSPETHELVPKYNVYDSISYGEFKGSTFIDIFEYNPGYIEWLIDTNQFAFRNLDDFWINGNPKILSLDNISDVNKRTLWEYLKNNNKASKYGDYRLSKKDVFVLKQKGILSDTDFCDSNFKFKETTIMINNASQRT